jgi:hypothetical protein
MFVGSEDGSTATTVAGIASPVATRTAATRPPIERRVAPDLVRVMASLLALSPEIEVDRTAIRPLIYLDA